VATPTGHAGRLLAQLVLAKGALTVDAVVDDLWPEADPGVARNRLHQVLHRLRRTLNVAADGPITVTDGVLRLDGASIHSDVTVLRSLDPSDRGAALEAVRSYASDLCAAQFAYDDAFDDARWELSSRLHDVAVALLAGDGARDPEVTAAVWDAWVRLADEDRIGLTLADALERVGQDDRAAELRDRVTGRPDPPSPG
jgi:DNA-binding SARP family transcriptional activator